MMDIREGRLNEIFVAEVGGRIDTSSSPAFEEKMRGWIRYGERRLLLDLTGVDFISSMGLRVFLILLKLLEQVQGKAVLCGVGPVVKQLFEMAGFGAYFTMTATRDEAIAALRA